MSGVPLLVAFVVFGILHSAFDIDIVSAASAQEPPALMAPVNDFADVIDADVEGDLDRRIRALQRATGDTVVVATVRTYQPYADIASYAVKMFENGGRGIGQRGKDNGVLIVVAVDERRVRVETGYDLEPFVTDAFAGETIRSVMRPRFAAGDYGGGLLAGATQIINRIAERRGVELTDVPRTAPPSVEDGSDFPVGLVIFLILILLALSFMGGIGGGRRRRRGGPWIVGGNPWSGWNSGVGPFGGGTFGGGFGGFGGGGRGGGFGGFGGGRSGGGGASGGW